MSQETVKRGPRDLVEPLDDVGNDVAGGMGVQPQQATARWTEPGLRAVFDALPPALPRGRVGGFFSGGDQGPHPIKRCR